MAGGAIHSFITADNSDYRAALASMESDTARAVGRVGGIIKAQTKGFRDLTSAVVGVGSSIGVAYSAFHAGQAVREVFDVQARLNAAIETERELRAQALLQADALLRVERERLGLQKPEGPNVSAVAATSSQLAAMVTAAQERSREAADQLANLQDMLGRDGTLFGLDTGNAAGLRATIDEATASARFFSAMMRESNAQMARAVELDAQLAEQQTMPDRKRRVESVQGMERSVRVELLRSEGRETEALRQAEHDRFLAQLQEITRLEEASGARYDTLRGDAERFHQSEMERIGREAGARGRAAREALVLSGREMDAEEARAAGDTARANRIDEEIRLYRQLREIKRSGLDEEEKRRRSLQAIRTSALRLRDRDRDADPSRDAEIRAGTGRDASLLRQVFPGASNAASAAQTTANASKRTADAVDVLKQLVTTIVNGGLKVPAVLAR